MWPGCAKFSALLRCCAGEKPVAQQQQASYSACEDTKMPWKYGCQASRPVITGHHQQKCLASAYPPFRAKRLQRFCVRACRSKAPANIGGMTLPVWCASHYGSTPSCKKRARFCVGEMGYVASGLKK